MLTDYRMLIWNRWKTPLKQYFMSRLPFFREEPWEICFSTECSWINGTRFCRCIKCIVIKIFLRFFYVRRAVYLMLNRMHWKLSNLQVTFKLIGQVYISLCIVLPTKTNCRQESIHETLGKEEMHAIIMLDSFCQQAFSDIRVKNCFQNLLTNPGFI